MPVHRRHNRTPRRRPAEGPFNSLISTVTGMDPALRERILFFVLTLAGILLLSTPWPILGWVPIAWAAFVILRWNVPEKMPDTNWVIAAALSGFYLLLYGFLSLDSMTHWLTFAPPIHAGKALPSAAGGFLLLLGTFRWIREKHEATLNPWLTSGFLGLILLAGLYLRLHPLGEPYPFWTEDCCLSLVDGRSSLDFPDHRQLIYEYGSRQPFIPYLISVAYNLFPDGPSLLIQKVVWGLVDGVAIWLAYLLGKELGGRRTGLILAAALAFSKPVLINCVSAQVLVSTPLALGVILLFTFRFFRKPDLTHALTWGAAMAFGAYSYHTAGPYLWWVPVAATAWFLFGNDRSHPSILPGVGLIAVWTYLFVRVNIHPPHPVLSHPAVTAVALLLAAWLLRWGYLQLEEPKPTRDQREAGLIVLGLFTAGLLMAPMILHPHWATHSQGASVFNVQNDFYPKGGLTFSFWWGKFRSSFADFFLTFSDRPDMGLAYEAFWNIHAVLLIFAGLAWAVIRRNRTALLLLGCAAVGMLPHLLSFGSHTGRLMGVVTPLLLLGAVSWDALLRSVETRGAWVKRAGTLLLVLWGLWSYADLHHRFLTVLFKHSNDVTTVLHALRENMPQKRVYLLGNEYLPPPWVLNPLVDDRGDLLLCKRDGNEVPRFPGGHVPDIVLYFHGSDPKMLERVTREYPQGRLEKRADSKGYIPPSPGAPYLYLFYLDGKDIPSNPRLLFHTVDVPKGSWSRRYYAYQFGLGHGILSDEEWVTDLLAPAPGNQGNQTSAIRGVLRVEKAGKYGFTVEGGGNYAVLDIGGKRVLDYRPTAAQSGKKKGSLNLKAGEYPVVLRTLYKDGLLPPTVKVLLPGEKTAKPLGSF